MLGEIGDAETFENLCGSVATVIVNTDNLYMITSLYLTQRPQTRHKVLLLIIGDNNDGEQRLVAL